MTSLTLPGALKCTYATLSSHVELALTSDRAPIYHSQQWGKVKLAYEPTFSRYTRKLYAYLSRFKHKLV